MVTFLRSTFVLFTLFTVFLIFLIISTHASAGNDVSFYMSRASTPIGGLATCALILVLAAFKFTKPLAYIAIGLMASISIISIYVPMTIGMHYHPDENWTLRMIVLFTPIIAIALWFWYLTHGHFKKVKDNV